MIRRVGISEVVSLKVVKPECGKSDGSTKGKSENMENISQYDHKIKTKGRSKQNGIHSITIYRVQGIIPTKAKVHSNPLTPSQGRYIHTCCSALLPAGCKFSFVVVVAVLSVS